MQALLVAGLATLASPLSPALLILRPAGATRHALPPSTCCNRSRRRRAACCTASDLGAMQARAAQGGRGAQPRAVGGRRSNSADRVRRDRKHRQPPHSWGLCQPPSRILTSAFPATLAGFFHLSAIYKHFDASIPGIPTLQLHTLSSDPLARSVQVFLLESPPVAPVYPAGKRCMRRCTPSIGCI